MIVTEQLLSAKELQYFQTTLSDVSWDDGTATAMGMSASVKSNLQATNSDPKVRELANRLLAKIGECLTILSAALPQRIFPPCFNLYQDSGEYGYHVDAAIMRIPESQEVLRSDVSMTVFLTDPDRYDGGELVIATEFGEQKVKLKAGHAVVYPSSSLHKVTAVTKGKRLAAITWMQSLVADVNLRTTLRELDISIQNLLSQNTAEREDLDRLHNVYHNLVRQFSQP
jgi:PKHD-type hydroxylase